MRSLRTERLDLVPVTIANARDVWRVLQQPNLREYQDIPRSALEDFERLVRGRPKNLGPGSTGRFEWLVTVRETQTNIGWISLRINDRTRTQGELGYSLLAHARGSGFATESLAAVVEESFERTELHELHACAVPDNAASRRVLERTGFIETRVLRGGAVVRTKRVDVVLYIRTRAQDVARRRELTKEHAL